MMAALNRTGKMTLDILLHGLIDCSGLNSILIEGLCLDSRRIAKGDLFIAVAGFSADGRDYIEQAIESGAAAVIWECEHEVVPIPVRWRETDSGRRVAVIGIQGLSQKVGYLADRFYQAPSKNLYMVGITGTNGKTSCSHYIAQALENHSHCGVIGTLGWGFLGELNASTHTTPDVVQGHCWLAAMREQQAQAVAMEVSSHALDQGRVANIDFDCAVFTNLSRDHLDYHGSLENYAAAKTRLFEISGLQQAVINRDDELGKALIELCSPRISTLSYGLDAQADVFASDIKTDSRGTSFKLHTAYGFSKVNSALLGRFNVYNLLACAGVLLARGATQDEIVARLEAIQPVIGRMQVIRESQGPVVVVDYAHTPDALEQALQTLRRHFNGKLWCVFGCGGDRDMGKRPLMAAAAVANADKVVMTSDNPRTESIETIIEQMLTGLSAPAAVEIEYDRAKAIDFAITHAEQDDVVLIAGKGHETVQIIGTKKQSFSDVDVALSCLEGLQHG